MPTNNHINEESVSNAKNYFKHKTTVAFLGSAFVGKTVHCALIKNTVAKYLYDATNKNYEGLATTGSEKINKIIYNLYDEKFPVKTDLNEDTKVVIEITSHKFTQPIEIILQDMPGEKYYDFLIKEISDDELIDRRSQIINFNKRKEDLYGPMTHLLFAKIYVILLDCSEYEKWDGSQGEIATTIQNLYKLKNSLDLEVDGKIHDSIAIVFTKYDKLESNKTAEELYNELKEIQAAFRRYVEKEPTCFTSKINCRSLTDDEIDRAINNNADAEDKNYIKLKIKLQNNDQNSNSYKKSIEDQKVQLSKFESELSNLENDPNIINSNDVTTLKQIKSAENNVNREKLKLGKMIINHKKSIADGQIIRSRINDINSERNRISVERNHISGGHNDNSDRRNDKPLQTLRTLNIPDHVPIRKFEYNHDEYIKLIEWFIEKNHDITKNRL